MKNWSLLIRNSLLFLIILVLDRASKLYVLHKARIVIEEKIRALPLFIRYFISVDKVVNRGISWGFLSTQSKYVFLFITTLIIGIIIWLSWYAYYRARQGKTIIAETCVIAGAFSNVVDRVMYGGVIDFINLSVGFWHFPATFNVADVFIVGGIFLMLITHYMDD